MHSRRSFFESSGQPLVIVGQRRPGQSFHGLECTGPGDDGESVFPPSFCRDRKSRTVANAGRGGATHIGVARNPQAPPRFGSQTPAFAQTPAAEALILWCTHTPRQPGSGSAPKARARSCPGEIGARAPGSRGSGDRRRRRNDASYTMGIEPNCSLLRDGHMLHPPAAACAARGTSAARHGDAVAGPRSARGAGPQTLACKLLGAPAGPSRVGWIVVRRRRGVHPKQYAGTPASFSS